MSSQKHTINSPQLTYHKYKCHECNERFARESERDNHRRTIHSMSCKVNVYDPDHTCINLY